MKEIIVKSNNTKLKVFINGIPNLKLIPKDEAENVVIALELQISEFYKSKHNHCNNK